MFKNLLVPLFIQNNFSCNIGISIWTYSVIIHIKWWSAKISIPPSLDIIIWKIASLMKSNSTIFQQFCNVYQNVERHSVSNKEKQPWSKCLIRSLVEMSYPHWTIISNYCFPLLTTWHLKLYIFIITSIRRLCFWLCPFVCLSVFVFTPKIINGSLWNLFVWVGSNQKKEWLNFGI